MSDNFTWIPFFQELAQKLSGWEDRQSELIGFLKELRDRGLSVTLLNDKDSQEGRFLLEEIDPFTFMGSFNRGTTDDQRFNIAREIKSRFSLESPVPEDFAGVPTLSNQSSWFFAYKPKRGLEDVANLWRLHEIALRPQPLEDPAFIEYLDRVLDQPLVHFKITMGLFWIRPDTFISLDQHMRSYLGIALPKGGLTGAFYRDAVKQALSDGESPPELSHQAWMKSKESEKPLTAPPADLDVGYWLLGAYWQDAEPRDQTERFVENGIWENGYDDKYLEEVKSIDVGDRVGIKAAATQKSDLPFDARGNTVSKMIIKAVGTVVANEGDGRLLHVEWDPSFESKEWYFFTNRGTVWRLRTDEGYKRKHHTDRLIPFVWQDEPQDYDWYVHRWFGDEPEAKEEGEITSAYSVEDILSEGAFMDIEELEGILERIRAKKTVILQGPPGVGKTFIAQRLAYALMEERDDHRVQMVQFHQSYSYEDFVRGYRPSTDQAGSFALHDGVFFEFCERARKDPDLDFVFIIDEINRGNLSQIFGEALMLIEGDKRSEKFALPLMYRRPGEANFYVPRNLHLIGLMNVADRSLAMIDYALRRRFAFVDLQPRFSHPTFSEWLSNRGMSSSLIDLVVEKMSNLNGAIESDPLLGPNYLVGHSFFCPKGSDFSQFDTGWYLQVVNTEIAPLLREYWYDNASKARDEISGLTAI